MPHHFFLSYAPADSSPLVTKFFFDLSDIIRITSGLPRNEAVGFYEESGSQLGTEWSGGAAAALQTCRSMVCLLSPAYFHSERAGQEWNLFEMRMRAYFDSGLQSRPTRGAQVILPVNWAPWQGSAPSVINQMLIYPGSVYQTQPVTTMFKARVKLLAEYSAFVKTLAYQIMEMTDGLSLPPLNSLPSRKDVHSSFHLWEESADHSSETGSGNGNAKPNLLVIDEEFLRSMALRMNEIAAGGSPAHSQPPSKPDARNTSHPMQPETPLASQVQPYTVSILDEDFGKMFKEALKTHDFEVTLYESAEELARKIDSDYSSLSGPDLFVIDLPGDSKNNLELIRKLTTKNIPSSKIAISTWPSNLEEPLMLGAVMFEKGKPFDLELFIETMKHAAEYGRNRRHSRRASVRADSSRYTRPVFLSYRHAHRELAIGLTSQIEARGIGVWYAEDVKHGDTWNELAKKSIDDVRIFLPLITEDYAESNHCRGEIARFRTRLAVEVSEPPVLLPLVCGSLDSMKKHKIITDIIERHKPIDISPNQFSDGLKTLLDRIQAIVENGAQPV